MTLTEFHDELKRLPFGKRLPTAVYVYRGEEGALGPELSKLLDQCVIAADIPESCNVLKFSTTDFQVSFLAYPGFFDDPHPALHESIRLDLATGRVKRFRYVDSPNPPILHRKETFLPSEHPDVPRFSAMTTAEEKAGLFENPRSIGFKLNWERLLAEKGLSYEGHSLIRTSADDSAGNEAPRPALHRVSFVQRHRTAISRYDLSKPIKTLLEFNVLASDVTLFDYGCGLGSDVKGLKALGYDVSGWDPKHAPNAERTKADIVNLGYVLNVIEDPAERIQTLHDAYSYADNILVVTTLVAGRETYAAARPYRDGVLTSRNTFQKYYDQTELQHLIEEALETDAVAVGLGIFYVFRHPEDRQDFLSRRTRRPINWEALNARIGFERPEKRAPRVRLDLYQKHQEILDDFFQVLLEFGRLPKDDEYPRMPELREAVKSPNQAERIFIKRFGEETYDQAREARRNDLLVFLAMDQFGKPSRFKGMSTRLQRDIKAFFGAYTKAREKARELLFSVGDPGEIELACEELDFGWDESDAFLFHNSLLNELPPILRIYVQCAAKLYGDPEQADIIKIHKHSGKLTFQVFDDFEGKNLPELRQRIKINLRTLSVDVFDHENWHEHQLLYFKERFVSKEHSESENMQEFSAKLRKLGLNEDMGFGPTKEEFHIFIAKKGLTLNLNRIRRKR